MKRYPLQTLLRLREHRADAARMVVLERKKAVQDCAEACTRIEGEISDLDIARADHRKRLLDPPASGVAWPAALAQREAHIEWLAAQREAATHRLVQAQTALQQAEQQLAEAREAFFRAKARQDALEKRNDSWRGEQNALLIRVEEVAAEDNQFAQRVRVGE